MLFKVTHKEPEPNVHLFQKTSGAFWPCRRHKARTLAPPGGH